MNREVHVRFSEGVGVRFPRLLDYLKAYETVAEARQGMANYFRFYNRVRRHQGLNRQTPDQVYDGSVMWPVAA